MRRFVWIIIIVLLVAPMMGVSAQSSVCPPQLVESANRLIEQAREAIFNGQYDTADVLLAAAQELLLPCTGFYATPFPTPTPPRGTAEIPTPFPTPTQFSSLPTVYDGVNEVNTVITTLGIFNDDVRGVDYSPNGFYAIASSFDSNLYMYDVETFEQVRVFRGHTDWVFNADFTQNGTIMASASADDTIRIWDVNSATTLQVLDAHTENVTNVAFSPDDSLLVSTGQDSQVIVWDTTTWTIVQSLDGHSDWVWDVSFSPDGSFFVTVASDNTVVVWSATDFSLVTTLFQHTGVVISVEYSPDGRYILTGSHDGSAILWDAVTFAPIRAYRPNAIGAVMDVAFSPDMQYVAIASFAGYVYMWTLDGTPVATHTGHTTSGVWAVQFSPDGRTFLSGADDGGMLLNSVWLGD